MPGPNLEDVKQSAQLIRGYVYQETVEQVVKPVLGTNLWAVVSALSFGLAIFFGALAELRGLEVSSFFRGNMSWLAYLIVAFSVVAALVVVALLLRSTAKRVSRER